LLDRDDDKDTKDNSGRTALHYAAENGDEAIVQLLVEQGANKRIRDDSKETALHIAVMKL
jgi:ankyrin repeat protein